MKRLGDCWLRLVGLLPCTFWSIAAEQCDANGGADEEILSSARKLSWFSKRGINAEMMGEETFAKSER